MRGDSFTACFTCTCTRAGGRVPDTDRPLAAGGGEPGTGRADRHSINRASLAGQGRALLAAWPCPRSALCRPRRH